MAPKKGPANNLRNPKRKSDELSTDDSDEDFRKVKTRNWPRFLCIETADPSKPLSKLSIFAVSKGLHGLIGDPEGVKRIRPDVLLVECKRKSQSDSLLKITQLVDRSVEVKPHQTLNSSKGIVRSRELQHESLDSIKKHLHSQGVTDVHRISIKKNGEMMLTNTYILTFNTPTAPTRILAGYWSFNVDTYIPNPLRCFHCQRFGHHRNSCKRNIVCAICSESHDGKECKNEPKCFNCDGDHPSFARSCPIWHREKEIQRTKVENNISFPEARERVLSSLPNTTTTSYANVVKSSTKQSRNAETQTIITWPYNAPNYKTINIPDQQKSSVDTQTHSSSLSQVKAPEKNTTSPPPEKNKSSPPPQKNKSSPPPEKNKSSSPPPSRRPAQQPGGSEDPVPLLNKFDSLMETETEETSSPPPKPKPNVKPKPPIKPVLPP